jgi:UDP-N-acetylglucosamine 1-carboxyvinyltransferase
MEQYVIKGGTPLVGEVDIAGAKNAALPILSAAIMSDETVTLENLPDVNDINVLIESIEKIGAHVERPDVIPYGSTAQPFRTVRLIMNP